MAKRKNPWQVNRSDPHDYNSARARAWEVGYTSKALDVRRAFQSGYHEGYMRALSDVESGAVSRDDGERRAWRAFMKKSSSTR